MEKHGQGWGERARAVLPSCCAPSEPPPCQRSAALRTQRRAECVESLFKHTVSAFFPALLGKRASQPASPKGSGTKGSGSLPRLSSERLAEMESARRFFVRGKPRD